MRPALPRVLFPLLLASSALAVDVMYGNPRFDYWVNVPGDLGALRPPDNGNGQSWVSGDGLVRVAAWGSYGPGVFDAPSVSAWAAYTERQEVASGSRVTYRRLLPGAFVLSGYQRDGRIFYQRVLVRDGTEAAVRVMYPEARRGVWDARTARIAASLRWGL
ncbi:hypothetical protein [Deinococcus depolymerans]|uniref:Uncharacterized protein n=1 Tax=Deinococcus depolymerans TaxID=392408 RepID=A0ABP3MEG5_9DEIO